MISLTINQNGVLINQCDAIKVINMINFSIKSIKIFVYSNKISTFATKIIKQTNKNMDIRARIEEVINEKGLTKKEVADRMGKFSQAFKSLLTNPKWETIELVANAIGISTQELLFGIKPEEEQKQQGGGLYASEIHCDEHRSDDAEDWLPMAATPPEKVVSKQGLICPHCGKAFVIEIKNIV